MVSCQGLLITTYGLSKHQIVHDSASKRDNFRMVPGCHAVSVLSISILAQRNVIASCWKTLAPTACGIVAYLLRASSSDINASALDNATDIDIVSRQVPMNRAVGSCMHARLRFRRLTTWYSMTSATLVLCWSLS